MVAGSVGTMAEVWGDRAMDTVLKRFPAVDDDAEDAGPTHWSEWGNEADVAALTKARDGTEIIRANRQSRASGEGAIKW